MTYHSRARRGPTPISPVPAVASWVIAALSAAGMAWFMRRSSVPGVDPQVVAAMWAMIVATVISVISAVGVLVVEGMRQQAILAPGVTLILIGLVGATFSKLILAACILGALWLVFALLRMGDKPYYL